MKTFRILVVEDEPLVAMDLEIIIITFMTAIVVVGESYRGHQGGFARKPWTLLFWMSR